MNDEYKSAKIFSRVVAKLIDLLIVAILTRIVPEGGFYVGILYILISDSLFDQRSIGKRFLGLKVRSRKVYSSTEGSTEGSTHSSTQVKDSIFRNSTIAIAIFLKEIPLIGWIFFMIIIFLELVIMLGNHRRMRIGDELANTEVIEVN